MFDNLNMTVFSFSLAFAVVGAIVLPAFGHRDAEIAVRCIAVAVVLALLSAAAMACGN